MFRGEGEGAEGGGRRPTVLVVGSGLGAVEAGGGAVGEQLLVVQVVGVVAGEAVPHAALLVEQPLVVHGLARARDLGLQVSPLPFTAMHTTCFVVTGDIIASVLSWLRYASHLLADFNVLFIRILTGYDKTSKREGRRCRWYRQCRG